MEFDLSLVGFFHKVQERSKAHDDEHDKLRLKEQENEKHRDQLIVEYITNPDNWYYHSKNDEYTLRVTDPVLFKVSQSEWMELLKRHLNVDVAKVDIVVQFNIMIFKFKE